jgi:hypothetical protein
LSRACEARPILIDSDSDTQKRSLRGH